MSISEENNQEGKSENEIICVLGASGVGKTSVIFKYLNKKCPNVHDITVEDEYIISPKEIGKDQEMKILDTSGDDYYQYMSGDWIKRANYFLLVFSKDVKKSDAKIEEYYDKIMKIKNDKKISIIIVENEFNSLKGDKKISEAVDKFAESKKLRIMRCSAFKGENIKNVFDDIINDYVKFEESKGCCERCISF